MAARAHVFDAGPAPGARSSILLPPLCQPSRDLGDPFAVVELPGPPQGKGRHRSRWVPPSAGKPGFIQNYPDGATKSYEGMLRYAAEREMAGRQLITGAVRLHVYSVFSPPVSWSNRKREAALEGYIRPTVKPDFDNIDKLVDAFKGVIWRDDVLVVDWAGLKFYAEKPLFRAEIWVIPPGFV